MIVYGVRCRIDGGPWKMARTITNPRGRWKKSGAEYIRTKLVKRGYQAHLVSIEAKVTYPTATHYSPNFRRDELNCKCGCTPPVAVQRSLTDLATGLEELRKELGHPLGVLNGHRCYNENERVGGARGSRHLIGEAADLIVPSGKQHQYASAATRVERFRLGGIGVYPNGGVHVDHRPYVARWNSFSR